MSPTVRITTVRTVAGDDEYCPDGRVCPSVHVVASRPERRYVVVKRLDDEAEVAAFAPMVGDDELVGWVPSELLPDL